ncbi:hypothetical protein CYMTET_16729 [Cymbomonas tetramitiformis]|uniref:Uncharacterized protein n=1 Tax=Cymbomonas tetramitiformis TaxID=36881 RepID=A0AAE0GBT7_9CHLO|nr:hypothetical protein CYMTET_16729 [Cymbomonas tetramitiformis]
MAPDLKAYLWNDMAFPVWAYGLTVTGGKQGNEVPVPPAILAGTIEEAMAGVVALMLGGRHMGSFGCLLPLFAVGLTSFARSVHQNDVEAEQEGRCALPATVQAKQQKVSLRVKELCRKTTVPLMGDVLAAGRCHEKQIVMVEFARSFVKYLLDRFNVPPRMRYEKVYPHKMLYHLMQLQVQKVAGMDEDARLLFYVTELSDTTKSVFGTSLEELWKDWRIMILSQEEKVAPMLLGKQRIYCTDLRTTAAMTLGDEEAEHDAGLHSASMGIVAKAMSGIKLMSQMRFGMPGQDSKYTVDLWTTHDLEATHLSVIDIIKWFLRWWYINEHHALLRSVLLTILIAIARSFVAVIIPVIITLASEGESDGLDVEQWLLLSTCMVLCATSSILIAYCECQVKYDCPTGKEFIPSTQIHIVRHLTWLPQVYIDSMVVQDMLTTLETDLSILDKNFDYILACASNLLQVITSLGTLFYFAPLFATWCTLFFIPVVALFDVTLGPHVVEATEDLLEKNNEQQKNIEEVLYNVSARRILQLQNVQDHKLAEGASKMEASFDKLNDLMYRHMRTMAMMSNCVRSTGLLYAILQLSDTVNFPGSSLTLSDYLGMIVAVESFISVYIGGSGIADAKRHFTLSIIPLKKVLAILRLFPDPSQMQVSNYCTSMEKEEMLTPSGPINVELREVEYCFPGKELAVINPITATFSGQTAVIGRSGSGKTTLVRLISRMLQPSAGDIRVGGVPLNILDIANTVAVMEQEVLLFDTTIRENITIGCRRQFADDELEAMAKLCHLQADPSYMEMGLDFMVGVRGHKLSPRARQQLAMARVLIRNTPVVVLDEGVSSQEQHTQQEIGKSIQGLTYTPDKGDSAIVPSGEPEEKIPVMVVAFTYSQSFVRDWPNIAMLKGGNIVEMGEKDELLSRRGHFWSLICSQDGLKIENNQASVSCLRMASMWPFYGVNEADVLRPLTSVFMTTKLSEGDYLFKEDAPIDGYYILVDGYIEERRAQKKVKVWAMGDTSGEWALYEDCRKYKTTAWCRSPTATLLYLTRDVFQNLLAAIPVVREGLMGHFEKVADALAVPRLEGMWPFLGLQKEELEELRQEIVIEQVAEGADLWARPQRCDKLYIVAAGELTLTQVPYGTQPEDEMDFELHRKTVMGLGRSIGELQVLLDMHTMHVKDPIRARTIRARANSPVLVGTLTRDVLTRLQNTWPLEASETMSANLCCFEEFSCGNMLADLWPFATIGEEHFETLAAEFSLLAMSEGELILSIEHGHGLDFVYVLLRGEVTVSKKSGGQGDSNIDLLTYLSAGSIINEEALVAKGGFHLSQRAVNLQNLKKVKKVSAVLSQMLKKEDKDDEEMSMTEEDLDDELDALDLDMEPESPVGCAKRVRTTRQPFMESGSQVTTVETLQRCIVAKAPIDKLAETMRRLGSKRTFEDLRAMTQAYEHHKSREEALADLGLAYLSEDQVSVMLSLSEMHCLNNGEDVLEKARNGHTSISRAKSAPLTTKAHSKALTHFKRTQTYRNLEPNGSVFDKVEKTASLGSEAAAARSGSPDKERMGFGRTSLPPSVKLDLGEKPLQGNSGGSSGNEVEVQEEQKMVVVMNGALQAHTKEGASLTLERGACFKIGSAMSLGSLQEIPCAVAAVASGTTNSLQGKTVVLVFDLDIPVEGRKHQRALLEIEKAKRAKLLAEWVRLQHVTRQIKKYIGLVPRFHPRKYWREGFNLCREYLELEGLASRTKFISLVKQLKDTNRRQQKEEKLAKMDGGLLKDAVHSLEEQERKYLAVLEDRRSYAQGLHQEWSRYGTLEMDPYTIPPAPDLDLSMEFLHTWKSAMAEVKVARRAKMDELQKSLFELWDNFPETASEHKGRQTCRAAAVTAVPCAREFDLVVTEVQAMRDRLRPAIAQAVLECQELKRQLERHMEADEADEDQTVWEDSKGGPHEDLLNRLKTQLMKLRFASNVIQPLMSNKEKEAKQRERNAVIVTQRNFVKNLTEGKAALEAELRMSPMKGTSNLATSFSSEPMPLAWGDEGGDEEAEEAETSSNKEMPEEEVPAEEMLEQQAEMVQDNAMELGGRMQEIMQLQKELGERRQKWHTMVVRVELALEAMGSDRRQAAQMLEQWGGNVGDGEKGYSADTLRRCEEGLKRLEARVKIEHLKNDDLAGACRQKWTYLGVPFLQQEQELRQLRAGPRIDIHHQNLEAQIVLLQRAIDEKHTRQHRAALMIQVAFKGAKTREKMHNLRATLDEIRDMYQLTYPGEWEQRYETFRKTVPVLDDLHSIDEVVKVIMKEQRYLECHHMMHKMEHMVKLWQKLKIGEEETGMYKLISHAFSQNEHGSLPHATDVIISEATRLEALLEDRKSKKKKGGPSSPKSASMTTRTESVMEGSLVTETSAGSFTGRIEDSLKATRHLTMADDANYGVDVPKASIAIASVQAAQYLPLDTLAEGEVDDDLSQLAAGPVLKQTG